MIRLAALAGAVVMGAYLLQARRFRARQYLASHTLWRGIRGGMDGSAFIYAAIAIAGWLAVVATLGLAYPWMRNRCWAYQLSRHALATGFSYEAPSGPPFGAWLVVWLSFARRSDRIRRAQPGRAAGDRRGLARGSAAGSGATAHNPAAGWRWSCRVFYVRYRAREFRLRRRGDQPRAHRPGRARCPPVSLVVAVLLHWGSGPRSASASPCCG